MFVRGGDAIYFGRLADGGAWSGWSSLGGQITSDPVAVTDGANVSVIVRGLGDSVWYGRLTNGTAWTGWRYLGGQITSDIGATVDGAGIELVRSRPRQCRSGAGASRRATRGPAGNTSAAQIISDPVAVTDGSAVEVFALGLGGGLWHGRLTSTNTWSGWHFLGGILTSDVGATLAGGGVDVFASGLGAAVWHGRLTNGGAWSGWDLVVG